LIGGQLIGWVNLIISNDQIMNSQPVPNIFFDLIGNSISDKEILVNLLLCENNETMFEVKLQLQISYFESVVGQWGDNNIMDWYTLYSNSKQTEYLFQRYEAMENEVDKYRG